MPGRTPEGPARRCRGFRRIYPRPRAAISGDTAPKPQNVLVARAHMQHGRDAMDGRRRCIGLDLGTILRDAHIYFMGLRPISEAGTLLVGTILTIHAKYFLKEDVP